eukprot:m.62862 g.62862  ORF g.62862 m.62862 type:complete len:157 (+) comp11539_c0_seq4:595-1065(+)
MIAALELPYVALKCVPPKPWIDDIVIIFPGIPSRFMSFPASRMQTKVPNTFTLCTASKSSLFTCKNGAIFPIPATATHISSPKHCIYSRETLILFGEINENNLYIFSRVGQAYCETPCRFFQSHLLLLLPLQRYTSLSTPFVPLPKGLSIVIYILQ